MKKITIFFLFLILQTTFAQAPKSLSSTEIYHAIEKLNFLGSVLYVGAHPDDENTKLISYYANHANAETAYLSLTRGDGGQNLIGPEIRELLGVIRTEELLTARKIDGGKQFFSRANDFGFSKNPEETFDFWDKQKVLSDVVWAIRKFQPDIIIDRFDHRTEGNTHGHHTASARLSVEAFDIANNKTTFPEQLTYTDSWQPKRLFFNTSWWFYGSKENFEKKADLSSMLPVDVGVYYPLRGISNTEIASKSRSQHKSQGFGNTAERGSETEYLEYIKGEKLGNSLSVFAGIDTTWNRVKGAEKIGKLLAEVEAEYDFKNPAASLPKLVNAYQLLQQLPDEHWKNVKSQELQTVIVACAGLYLEPTTTSNFAVPGEEITLGIEAINRSDNRITLTNVRINELDKDVSYKHLLINNLTFKKEISVTIPTHTQPTSPYWLRQESSVGMYAVENQKLIGLPETPAPLSVTFELNINQVRVPITKPVVFKTNDPVKGEVYKPFAIVPAASVALKNSTLIFPDTSSKKVEVHVKAFQEKLAGELQLQVPSSWNVSPKSIPVSLTDKDEEKTVTFTLTPPKDSNEGIIQPVLSTNGKTFSKALHVIDYDHIPQQTVLLPAQTKVLRLDIEKKGNNIAYIEGAGDVVPESLRAIGYQVTVLSPAQITSQTLQHYDAVVIGIRAYNTVNELVFKQQTLFDYVKQGGTMIVQYNTNRGLKTDELAPYSLHLSRDRVTDEFSKIDFLAPKNPVLNSPNKITKKDFEGWVQERGLYFPDKWGKEFTPILGMNDKGEGKTKGSLLVAQYGKGYYVYTGLSFFREFPAGVAGAYRLFANLLSLGN